MPDLALVLCLGSILFLFSAFHCTFWGLNWEIARNVNFVLSAMGFVIGVGLFRLKLWALKMYIAMAIFNLFWILVERILFLNGYVVALLINVADVLRSFGRLECSKVSSPVFINTITGSSLIRDINSEFFYSSRYHLLVAIFYIATVSYIAFSKIKEQFRN